MGDEPRDDALEALDHGAAAEEVAAEVVQELLERGAAELFERYLKEREPGHVASAVLAQALHMTNFAYLKHDAGDHDVAEHTELTGRWGAEEEPTPSRIDSWARGAMPVKRRPRKSASPVVPGSEVPADVASRTATRTVASRRSRRARGSTAGQMEVDPDDLSAFVEPIDEDYAPNMPGGKKRAPGKILARADADAAAGEAGGGAETELSALEEKRRAEAARGEALEAEAREEVELIKRLEKDLKGQDYTIDENGKVIVIKSVNPDKLPPFATSVAVSVHGDDAEEPPPAKGKKKKKKGKGKKGGGSKPGSAGGKRDDAAGEFFQNSASEQPPLLQSLDLEAGVTLREGESSKQGPAIETDDQHMTRTDFLAHQNMLEQASMTMTGGDMTMLAPSPREDAATPMLDQTRPADLVGGVASPKAVAAEVVETKRLNSAGSDGMGRGGLEGTAFDPLLSGGRRVETPQPEADEEGDFEDPVMALIGAEDWGSNGAARPFDPPTIPLKPSTALRAKTLGAGKPKNPRDRQPVTAVTTQPRKRLPAPMPGQTTGHGVLPKSPTRSSLPASAKLPTIPSPTKESRSPLPSSPPSSREARRRGRKKNPFSAGVSPGKVKVQDEARSKYGL